MAEMPRPAFAERLDALLLLLTATAAAALLIFAAMTTAQEEARRVAAAVAGAETAAGATARGLVALQAELDRLAAALDGQSAGRAMAVIAAGGAWQRGARSVALRDPATPGAPYPRGGFELTRDLRLAGAPAMLVGILHVEEGERGIRQSLLQPDGRLLRSGLPPVIAEGLVGGRGLGPTSGADAAIAVVEVPGMPLRVVAELPLAPALAEGRAFAHAVRAGAIALAGLLAAAALAVAMLRRRSRAALQAEAAGVTAAAREVQQRETRRFFAGLPAAVYQGELFPDGTFRLDFLSDAAEEVLGHSAAALRRSTAWDALPEQEGLAAVREFRRRLLDGGEALVEFPARRRDGARTWLRDHARVTGRGRAGYAAIAGIVQDVSAERELRDQAAMASKLATLGTMATSIAHELTQPLSAILLAGEAALEALPSDGGEPAARAQRRISRLLDQASRARGLVDHLRAFGRADAGPAEEVNLPLAVDGALTLVAPLLDTAGIALTLELPDDLPPVRGRQLLTEQVVVNLLVNARDAMLRQPEEMRRIAMFACHLVAEERVRLTVEDSGPGFAPGAVERLFEPYFTTKATGAGTGLGLSICRSILRSFGGEILAEDTGRGARFTLDLPVVAATALAEVQDA